MSSDEFGTFSAHTDEFGTGPAPDGYTWFRLTRRAASMAEIFGGFGGESSIALLCARCGALVADHQAHDGWHDRGIATDVTRADNKRKARS